MMREFRYALIGLLLGMTLALLGGAVLFALPAARAYSSVSAATATASVAPASTASPTEAPTSTPSPMPPTLPSSSTPLPSATPDAIQSLINSGGLVFTGPLTNTEQVLLYKAAMFYARDNMADSRHVAAQINGAGYGDPGNVCGPLAIAILRDAGLISPEVVPHDYWLLNPLASADAQLLERTFPHQLYMYFKDPTPINKMDWAVSRLLPGDFLFIWHGSGGNFDHMLIVSRVDDAGRAYAVTNYGTKEGYIIAEALLYDPGDPNAGLFHIWTQEQNAILGSTGFGGFELWRRRGP